MDRRTYSDIFLSGGLLRGLISVVYGVPPRCMMRKSRRPLWHLSAFSVLLITVIWASFGLEMYCAGTYWRYTIPLETLLLLVALVLSGACSCTLFFIFFYRASLKLNADGVESIIPQFDFDPWGNNHSISIPIPRKTWITTNILLFVGATGVALVFGCDFGLNIFFDFYGIHNFTESLSPAVRNVYFTNVWANHWGFLGVVVGCCVFYIICQDIACHIDYTENLIINEANDFGTAKRFHECLLQYTENVTGTLKVWFILHSLFFFFVILSIIVEWIVVFSELDKNTRIVRFMLAIGGGSMLIAFKYAFPFWAASKVTSRFNEMYRRINRDCKPRTFPEIDVFSSYCIRCKAGFTVFGVQVTARLALFSLLSCFVGFFKIYKALE